MSTAQFGNLLSFPAPDERTGIGGIEPLSRCRNDISTGCIDKPCKLLKRRIDRPGRTRSVDSYENCSFACFVEVCHHT